MSLRFSSAMASPRYSRISGPLAIGGCLFLFSQLSTYTELLFISWTSFGIVVYLAYGRRHSHLAHGEPAAK